jgi:type II secretory pathway pseudopilin PulG
MPLSCKNRYNYFFLDQVTGKKYTSEMKHAGYSAIEILAAVAIVLTLSVVVLPNLGNLDRGSKQSVAVRNAALLNNAVQQYDQLGGADRRPLLTSQVPVPAGVENIRDPNLLPEMKVLSLLENQDGTSFITRSQPTFADEGYRLIWVNDYVQPAQPVVGRDAEAEKLVAAGQGGRFELIGPDSPSNSRLGITGFTESGTGLAATNTAVAFSMTPTPRPTPVPSPLAIDASGTKVTTGSSPSPTSTPRMITPRAVSPTPLQPDAPPTPIAVPNVDISVEPWVGTRLSTFTFRAKGYSPDGSSLLYSFTLPDGTKTPYSPENVYRWFPGNQPAGMKNVSVSVRNSAGQGANAGMNFMLENIRPGVTVGLAPALVSLGQETTVYIAGYDDIDRLEGGRSLRFRMKWDNEEWGDYTDPAGLGGQFQLGGRIIGYSNVDAGHPLNGKTTAVNEISFEKAFDTLGPKQLTVQAMDSDGDVSDPFSVTLTVTDNLPPSVWFFNPPSQGKAGQRFEFMVAASDPEGEETEFSFRIVESYMLNALKGLDAVTAELVQRGRTHHPSLNDWTPFADVALASFTHPGNLYQSGVSDSFTIEVRARDSSGMISPTARHTVTIDNIPPRVWARASKLRVARGEEVDFSLLVMDENYSLPLPPANPVAIVPLKPVNLNLIDQILYMHTGGAEAAVDPRSILQIRWQYVPEKGDTDPGSRDMLPWETSWETVGTLGFAPTLRENLRRKWDLPGSYTLHARIVPGKYLEWEGGYNWRLERESPNLPTASATVVVTTSQPTVGFVSVPSTVQVNKPAVFTAEGQDPQGGKLQYSFRLTNVRNRDREQYPEAWDKTWTEFQDSPSAAFIPPGLLGGDLGISDYIVEVRARNAGGQVSEIAEHGVNVENSPARIWVKVSKPRVLQGESIESTIFALAPNNNMGVSPPLPAGVVKLPIPPQYYGPEPAEQNDIDGFMDSALEMRWVGGPVADSNTWQSLGSLNKYNTMIITQVQTTFYQPGKRTLQVRIEGTEQPFASASVDIQPVTVNDQAPLGTLPDGRQYLQNELLVSITADFAREITIVGEPINTALLKGLDPAIAQVTSNHTAADLWLAGRPLPDTIKRLGLTDSDPMDAAPPIARTVTLKLNPGVDAADVIDRINMLPQIDWASFNILVDLDPVEEINVE